MHCCFKCETPWESSLRQPAVKETCSRCGSYLHCCRNCRFHRKGYPNECYIPDTEKIADKTRANFCDEFEFRPAKAGREEEVSRANAGERDAMNDWLEPPERSAVDFDDLFKD